MSTRFFSSVVALLALTAAQVCAQSGPYKAELLAPFKIVASKAGDSTVSILCNDKDAALGTVVFADGYILTKASELRGTISVMLSDGSAYEVSIVGVHPETDLALLKLDLRKASITQLKPVKFADSKKVPVGNWLVAPSPNSDPLAVGIVSVMTRDLSGFEKSDKLNKNRGFLGIFTGEVDKGKGVKVTDVSKDSGAQKAGLKKDDIITHLDGKEIADPDELRATLANYQKDDKVKVKLRRKDETKELEVTLGEATKDRSDIQNSWGSTLSGRRTGFPTILQTDMVVNADKCGGPVLDIEGNVLGINIARAGRVETWVLPSEVIRPLLNDLKNGKYPLEVKKTSPKEEDSTEDGK